MWKVVWARTTESTGPIRVARKSQPLGLGRELVLCHIMDYQRSFWCLTRMVVTRRLETGSRLGSGAGSQDRPALSEDNVREILQEETIEDDWVIQDSYG